MTQNLLREYRALGGGSVMGIYGAYHTSMTSDDGVQTMASRLTEALGDSVISARSKNGAAGEAHSERKCASVIFA